MSYCVNCGVELDKTAAACALCNTPVFNPNQPVDLESAAPFPQKRGMVPGINRRYAAKLLTVLLLVPDVICLVVNLIYYHTNPFLWSVYVIGATFVLWVAIALPLIFRRPNLIWMVTMIGLSVLLYVYMIASIDSDQTWFFILALPVIALITVLTQAVTAIAVYKWPGAFYLMVFILAAVDLFAIGLEVLLDLFIDSSVDLGWSLIVVASLAGLMLILLVVAGNRHLRLQLEKRLHL